MEQALVFTSTQRDADWLADRLADMGHAVASLHGGMPQGRRNRVLQGLRSKQLRVLVATDVAARGIDVPSISHVINYGLPMKAEDYVHRIGRTGRAGRNGLAVTLAERMDTGMIRRIQQFTTQSIPVATIAGLEPKNPQPRVFAARPESRFGDKPFGKPAFAAGKGYGKKPFAGRERTPFERSGPSRRAATATRRRAARSTVPAASTTSRRSRHTRPARRPARAVSSRAPACRWLRPLIRAASAIEPPRP